MSPRRIVATARRVLVQLRHDHRTVGLMLLLPSLLLVLLKFVFDGQAVVFDSFAPLLVGIFPLITMFLVASITTLRERNAGTLDRLMTLPIAKADFIFGYALAFTIFALVQASLVCVVLLGVLHVPVAGGALLIFVSSAISGFLGAALGLFASAFARSEFQAIQFMPAFLFPQLLTCGLFVARGDMAQALQWFADVMPLTYSVDAMQQITHFSQWSGQLTRDLAVVLAYGIAVLLLAALTIRRQD